MVNESRFYELCADDRIWFGESGNNVPSQKKFLSEVKDGVTPLTIWTYKEVGHNQAAKKEIKNLFEGSENSVFDTPKPLDLMKRLLEIGADNDSIVMDFFAGSATLAHATMISNFITKGFRRCISVQLPEKIQGKNSTLADIAKERIYLAGNKILQDNADKEGIENLDIGFKVFKLDSSNIKPWDADFDNLENTLLDHVENIKDERSEDDVLYEILLKYGLDLTVPIEERSINGKTVYAIGLGALVVCLADDISLEVVEGIGKLKVELQPEVMRVVFKDNGFKDDVVKTNAIQNLKKQGIDDVKSL